MAMTILEERTMNAIIQFCRDNGTKHPIDKETEFVSNAAKDILCALIPKYNGIWTEAELIGKSVRLAQKLYEEFKPIQQYNNAI